VDFFSCIFLAAIVCLVYSFKKGQLEKLPNCGIGHANKTLFGKGMPLTSLFLLQRSIIWGLGEDEDKFCEHMTD
jgi:hypothetical protein